MRIQVLDIAIAFYYVSSDVYKNPYGKNRHSQSNQMETIANRLCFNFVTSFQIPFEQYWSRFGTKNHSKRY